MRTGNLALKILASWVAVAGIAVTSAASAKEPLPVEGPALLMFWAPWCAPCRQELREYDALSRAAPVPLIVVALDTTRENLPLLEGLSRERVRVVGGSSVANLAQWSPDTAGLPLTLGVDQAGNRCAAHSKRLDAEAIDRLASACKFKR